MQNNYDLIITTNNIKKYLLKNNSINKVVSNTKIMSLSEFKKNTVGIVKNNAVLALVNEFDISYNLAKVYIDNIFYKSDKLNKYYDFLLENNYIDKVIINNYKNALLINVDVDDFYKEFYSGTKFSYLEIVSNYNHDIYEYNTLEDEVSSVADKISSLLKTTDINKIKLVNVGSEYNNDLKRMFKFFNIPINIEEKVSIYKTEICEKFISSLEKNKNINKAFENINEGDIYNKLINYFNSSEYDEINYITIEKIKDDLKNICLDNEKICNAVECINFEDIYDNDNYYFVLGLNDGSIPKVFKDEDYLNDKEKSSLGLLTSLDKNKFNKKIFNDIYSNTKNLYLSYKLKSLFETFRVSNVIEDNNLNVIVSENKLYKNSNLYNKLELSKSLDNFIKFGEHNHNLNILYSNYDLPYLKYDNQFTGIDKEKINNITLSYTSINDYYNCSFKYYIKKILKLEESEETLALLIGNLFHYVLSKIYEENFNFELAYETYLKDIDLNNKDKLFIDILKEELKLIIDVIKTFDKNSNLNNNLLEKEVTVENIIPGKVKLYGIIDKLKTNEDKSLAVVIDYKTGTITSSVDNINYGLNLQLPIYLYLAKNLEPNIKVGGFYLQKILNNPKVDEDVLSREKALKLEGFSSSNIDVLSQIDFGYENSDMIKSLKMTSKGFSSYSKVLSDNQIDEIIKITERKIKKAAQNIIDGNFYINPKEINNDNVGCKYCKFKDLCFMKEENVVKLENNKIKDILGGEDNA